MSEPLFDASTLQRINPQPGDVFILELPVTCQVPKELHRLTHQLQTALNGARVIIPPPGAKLRRAPGPYCVRRAVDGAEIEVSFATLEEMNAYLERTTPVVKMDVPSLSDAERQRLEEEIQQRWANPNTRGKIVVAPAGATIEPMKAAPEGMDYAEACRYLSLAEEKAREPHKPRSWLDETMGSSHPAPDPVPMTATWHGSAIKLQDARWFGWSECDGRMRCAGYFRSPYWNFKGGVLVRLRNESNYDEFWASVWPSGHGEHQFLGVDEVDEEAARTYLRDWRQAIPSLSPAPSEKAAPDKDSPTADAPQFITAPDEQQRCCLLLDGTVESRCLNRTRYWVGKNGVDDYTHCCEQHLEEVFRPGDAIQDMQTGVYLDALAAQWSSVAPAEDKSKDSPPADTPEPDHTVNFREFL